MSDPKISPAPRVPDAYRLGLLALELASERVKDACQGPDIEQAAIETHFGLHSVYDLHEALFSNLRIKGRAAQDKYYASNEGGVAGALVAARGARTHDLISFASPGPFPDRPYGMGTFGKAWIWTSYSWKEPHWQQRSKWYATYVSNRVLWSPLDEAWIWFQQQILAQGM